MVNEPLGNGQSLGLPALERNGQVEVGSFQVLRQRYRIAGCLCGSRGGVRAHHASSVAEYRHCPLGHGRRLQVINDLNERLWCRVHQLGKHGRQMLLGTSMQSRDVLSLNFPSRDRGSVCPAVTVAQHIRQLTPRVGVPIPDPV